MFSIPKLGLQDICIPKQGFGNETLDAEKTYCPKFKTKNPRKRNKFLLTFIVHRTIFKSVHGSWFMVYSKTKRRDGVDIYESTDHKEI